MMLFNLTESTGIDLTEREEKDRDQIKTLFHDHLGAECRSPEKATRIGRRGDKPRPLKVVMRSEEDKIQIFRNAKKLREAPEPFNAVSISSDMTPEERETNKKLIAEAKEMDRRDESGDWIHLVRGPPWDRRIVKARRRRI